MKKIFEGWNRYLKENEDPLELWHNALLDALAESGEEMSLTEADEDIDIMPFKSEEQSGFCLYNPKINEFAIQSPETLAETLLFVFGTMQTPWPKFAPYFRFLMDMVQNGDDVAAFTDAGNKSKRADLIRRIYLDANGVDEASLSEEQKIYLEKAVSGTVMMASTPKAEYFNTTWENRNMIYDTIAPLVAKQQGEAGDLESSELLELYISLLKLPGLQKAKAGFAVQMLTGKMGCIDSIWSKIWKATDPAISAMVTQTLKGRAEGSEENIRKHAKQYVDLLKAIKEGSGLGSKELWDAWTEQVAFQIRNPGRRTFDYTIRDENGNVVLHAENEASVEQYINKKGVEKERDINSLKYSYDNPLTQDGDPSQTYPYYSSYPGDLEQMPELDDLTHEVTKQHDPRNLKYIKENLRRVIGKILKSRGIKIKR